MGPYIYSRYVVIFVTSPASLCDILRSSTCQVIVIWLPLTHLLATQASYGFRRKPKSSSSLFSLGQKRKLLRRHPYISFCSRTYKIFFPFFPTYKYSLYVIEYISCMISTRSPSINIMTSSSTYVVSNVPWTSKIMTSKYSDASMVLVISTYSVDTVGDVAYDLLDIFCCLRPSTHMQLFTVPQ